jgi:glutamine synthetase
MKTTKEEVLQFVEENDVKFIRLVFCDLFGMQKNISIMPDELEMAFRSGISFDASSILGFTDVENSDLFLRPDPLTLSLLPWRPQQGRVAKFYCSIHKPNGEVYEADTREILKKTAERLRKMEYKCKIGTECEFYLFKTDECGEPTKNPIDNGGYFDMAPLDRGENVRREICLSLEEMGLHPEGSHHEQGPGQNEIDFMFSDIVSSADDFMSFKTTVKAISAQNGLFASFMPKPIIDKSGNGLHVNISLRKLGENIFAENSIYKEESKSFIAGILKYVKEISLFLNPIPNSYERLGEWKAPKYISWSKQDRSQLIRIPAATSERSRLELRSPDPSINPYLAYAMIVQAGLNGIEEKLELPKSLDLKRTNSENVRIEELPNSLSEAMEIARSSEFVSGILGKELLEKYISLKGNPEIVNSKYFEYL